ncbi:MAG: OmpA family protein, partial [Alistipes sp.]|nr:OmpA family protein [Alistipes sp.]
MLPLLLVASMASWQPLAAQSHAAQPDSVLLSERVDGDYQLKSYRVQQPAEADFSLHYRIGNATLNPTLGENGEELDDLKKLAATLDDTLHHAQQVVVVGYASPDGPQPLNERLAKARAENFSAYLKKNAPHLAAAKVVCRSEVSPWATLREAVEKSDMAD